MATRKQNSLLTNAEAFVVLFSDNLALWIAAVRPSIAVKAMHLSPNLATIVLAFRKANNVSGMEFGKNRTRNGEVIVENGDSLIPTGNTSGFFSLIANVEQGGRKTDVPVSFLEYVAKATGVSLETIVKANEEDHAIRVAFLSANTKN